MGRTGSSLRNVAVGRIGSSLTGGTVGWIGSSLKGGAVGRRSFAGAPDLTPEERAEALAEALDMQLLSMDALGMMGPFSFLIDTDADVAELATTIVAENPEMSALTGSALSYLTAVGGVAELPEASAAESLEADGSGAGLGITGVAAAVTLGAAALGGAGLDARRRRLRT